MFYANIVPAGCLLLDMTLNKIKIKMSHLKFTLMLTLIYLLFALIFQIKTHRPVYIDNLNFLCKHNLAYLYERDTLSINQTVELETC